MKFKPRNLGAFSLKTLQEFFSTLPIQEPFQDPVTLCVFLIGTFFYQTYTLCQEL